VFVECPSCQEQVHAKLRNCTRCGAVMPHFAQEEAASAAAAADDGYVPITERLGRPYQSQAATGGGGSSPPPPRMPGGGGYGREPMPHVPNHLVWAILTTLLCCLPLGIVSIVYAAKVDGLVAAGDYDGAVSASNSAKTWAIASAGISVGLIVLYVLFVVVLGVAGGMAGK
jgi:hypothetical protein